LGENSPNLVTLFGADEIFVFLIAGPSPAPAPASLGRTCGFVRRRKTESNQMEIVRLVLTRLVTLSSGVARFFLVQNTKTGKNTKLPRTTPNVQKYNKRL
jgi:hypothetical protein